MLCLITTNAQVVIGSKFKSFSYDEMARALPNEETQRRLAEREKATKRERRERFDYYQNIAYRLYIIGDYYGFIENSSYALDTGFYNAKLYYDRGQAFENLGLKKEAKKEYKKARKHGYSLAKIALKHLKKKKL